MSVGDAKLVLMAIFGVKGNKRLDQGDQGDVSAQAAQYPDHALPFGWLHKAGEDQQTAPEKPHQLQLTSKCAQIIRRKFSLLNANRINNAGRAISQRKKERAEASRPKF